MIKKHIFIILFALTFFFLNGCGKKSSEEGLSKPSFEHPRREKSKDISKFGYCRVDKMAGDLDLSGEQLEKLKRLEAEITQKQIEMMRDRKRTENIKEKILILVKKDSLSKEEIIAFMDELHSLREINRKEADSFVAERLAEMHSVLTKEQRGKLAKKLEEFEVERKFKPKREIK